jgi:hypothetical protein
MTHLFMLMFLAGMQTADARHKHRNAKPAPPAKHHHVRPKPRHISHKTYHHDGHKYYDDHDGIVWVWRRGHWTAGFYMRGHWEVHVPL